MSSFRIYNKTLNPVLWDEYQHLNPEVRVNLLRMAYDFYEKSGLAAPIMDVYLMGSIASYNWTPESDADVHVIINFSQLQMPSETATDVAKTAGAQWNSQHNAFVKGFKVEMNIQNASEPKPYVAGIYSLVKDAWIRKPSHLDVNIDKVAIQSKYYGMKKYIESALQSGDRDIMKSVKKYLDAFRQYGLDTGGELSIENIVFKILRAKGIVKQLKDAINAVYDKEMSVKEQEEDFVPPKAGIGAIGSNDEVKFREVPWDTLAKQMHGMNGNPFGRSRFKYIDGKVEWTDQTRPDEEQQTLVNNYLERRGFPVTKHVSVYDNYMQESVNYDYIGGIVQGEPRGEPVKQGTVKKRLHLEFPGLYSGQNSTNWRYHADKNQVMWNIEPHPHDKIKIDNFLSKRGILNPTHKSMYKEVAQSDLKARHPNNSQFYDKVNGWDFEKMTLDNLKALKDKSRRALAYARLHPEVSNPTWVRYELDFIKKCDAEIKKRLEYINAPINEELENNKGEIVTPDGSEIRYIKDGTTARIYQAQATTPKSGFFTSAIGELKNRGFKTILIRIQSLAMREALRLLVKKGVLKNPRNPIGISVDEHPSTFDIAEGYGAGDPTKDPKAVGRWTVKYDSAKKLAEQFLDEIAFPQSNEDPALSALRHLFRTGMEKESPASNPIEAKREIRNKLMGVATNLKGFFTSVVRQEDDLIYKYGIMIESESQNAYDLLGHWAVTLIRTKPEHRQEIAETYHEMRGQVENLRKQINSVTEQIKTYKNYINALKEAQQITGIIKSLINNSNKIINFSDRE